MSPAVTAAIIAAGVSFLTLVGSLVTQFYGIRRTSRDTEKTRQQLDHTLAEQRERTLNERFATAADKLGSDKAAAVRLAGVYAMAGLADDWAENRQTCVDVLCAYLRMPYSPDPGEDASEIRRLAFLADREVRHTVIRVIAAHLRPEAQPCWSGLNLDFVGVSFDGGSFVGCNFGGTVNFSSAEFSGGTVSFVGSEFPGTVFFRYAKFSGGEVNFDLVEFSAVGEVSFNGAKFDASVVHFTGAKFSGGKVGFRFAKFSGGEVTFRWAEFTGGDVSFAEAEFTGSDVSFAEAEFTGSEVSFLDAKFTGSEVSFIEAEFTGGTVDFSKVAIWSRQPKFDIVDTPPAPVRLPPISIPGASGSSEGGNGSASTPAAADDQTAPS